MIFLSKWVICRFHVNLPGCMSNVRLTVEDGYKQGKSSNDLKHACTAVHRYYLLKHFERVCCYMQTVFFPYHHVMIMIYYDDDNNNHHHPDPDPSARQSCST